MVLSCFFLSRGRLGAILEPSSTFFRYLCVCFLFWLVGYFTCNPDFRQFWPLVKFGLVRGPSCAILEPSWRHLGAVLEPYWEISPGPSRLDVILGSLGAVLEPSWSLLQLSSAICVCASFSGYLATSPATQILSNFGPW